MIPPAWSARCDCRNDHSSSSGRCNARNVTDVTRDAGEIAICEKCRSCCPVGRGFRLVPGLPGFENPDQPYSLVAEFPPNRQPRRLPPEGTE